MATSASAVIFESHIQEQITCILTWIVQHVLKAIKGTFVVLVPISGASACVAGLYMWEQLWVNKIVPNKLGMV